MANGGPTPSCLYCKWFKLEHRRCEKHHFELRVSIPRILCSEMVDAHDGSWVEKEVDLKTFTPNMLYIWLEISFTDLEGKQGHTFNLYPFASIADYAVWSADQETEALEKLHEAQRLFFRKQGYTDVE